MSKYHEQSFCFTSKAPARRQTSIASMSDRFESNDRTWRKTCLTTDSAARTPCRYSVAMMGSQGVGKTSLVNQIVSSLDCDNHTDVKIQNNCLQITLNGKMTILFDDEPAGETTVSTQDIGINLIFENLLKNPQIMIKEKDVDAFLVVFSIADRVSFCKAKNILSFLHQCDFINDKAVVLVGNKTDLERSRIVQTKGKFHKKSKSVAFAYKCSYLETSDWMNHNVNELLEQLVSQIRLKCLKWEHHDCRNNKQVEKYQSSHWTTLN
uniref:Uncharacterized protein n=1 Tax=Strigamia maritima TaxID=126957 RepID=T1IZ62_STRMM